METKKRKKVKRWEWDSLVKSYSIFDKCLYWSFNQQGWRVLQRTSRCVFLWVGEFLVIFLNLYCEPRRSVKKRITNVSNIIDLEQEDERNSFDICTRLTTCYWVLPNKSRNSKTNFKLDNLSPYCWKVEQLDNKAKHVSSSQFLTLVNLVSQIINRKKRMTFPYDTYCKNWVYVACVDCKTLVVFSFISLLVCTWHCCSDLLR